jgi:glycosyltransferase involved in cell wall biosynthesis
MSKNTDNPLVSIVCVTYNHAAYIRDALDGFLMQKTNFSYEICLGEDGSVDETKDICLEYQKKNLGKIRLFERSRENVIFVDNKATGRFNFIETLKESRGKYIAICDGDDYWTDPYKLQKQIDFLENNNEYNMVHTNYSTLQNGIIKKSPDKASFIKDVKSQLLIKNFIGTLTICVKKSVLFDALPIINNQYQAGDLALWMQISQKSKIGYLKDKTAVYRISNNSRTSFKSTHDQLLFLRSGFKIKFDFIDKYKYDHETIDKVNHRWCRILFKFYIKLEDSDIKFELNNFIHKRKQKSLWIYKFILFISRIGLLRKILKKLWRD